MQNDKRVILKNTQETLRKAITHWKHLTTQYQSGPNSPPHSWGQILSQNHSEIAKKHKLGVKKQRLATEVQEGKLDVLRQAIWYLDRVLRSYAGRRDDLIAFSGPGVNLDCCRRKSVFREVMKQIRKHWSMPDEFMRGCKVLKFMNKYLLKNKFKQWRSEISEINTQELYYKKIKKLQSKRRSKQLEAWFKTLKTFCKTRRKFKKKMISWVHMVTVSIIKQHLNTWKTSTTNYQALTLQSQLSNTLSSVQDQANEMANVYSSFHSLTPLANSTHLPNSIFSLSTYQNASYSYVVKLANWRRALWSRWAARVNAQLLFKAFRTWQMRILVSRGRGSEGMVRRCVSKWAVYVARRKVEHMEGYFSQLQCL